MDDSGTTTYSRTANSDGILCGARPPRSAPSGHATAANITLRPSCTTAHVSDTHTNTVSHWAYGGANSQTAMEVGELLRAAPRAAAADERGSPDRKVPQCMDSVRLCSLGELRLMFDKLAMRDLTLCA